MANLSDYIESYLKMLFDQLGRTEIEIQRNELAEKFNCVPSQINYVLSTRFSNERGYIVESRRGGGGYIRIVRLTLDLQEDLKAFIQNTINDKIGSSEAQAFIRRLWEQDFLTNREAALLFASMDRSVWEKVSDQGDYVRARLLKNALLALLRERQGTR